MSEEDFSENEEEDFPKEEKDFPEAEEDFPENEEEDFPEAGKDFSEEEDDAAEPAMTNLNVSGSMPAASSGRPNEAATMARSRPPASLPRAPTFFPIF